MKKFISKLQFNPLFVNSQSGKRILLSNTLKAVMVVLLLFANSGFAAKSSPTSGEKPPRSTHHQTTKCWACNGSGQCSNCSGTGKLQCYNCGGTGSITDPYTGKTTTCNVCRGTGQVHCNHCNGSGTCSVCHGTGQTGK